MQPRRRSRLSLASIIEQLSLKIADKETCGICQLGHVTSKCPVIAKKICIADSAAPAKAFSSLPSSLECVPLANGDHKIVAKQRIAKGTQFGPLEAPRSAMKPSAGAAGRLDLKIFHGREIEFFLDTTEKSLCNWMTLVKFSPKLNNLICYQLRSAIYFTTISEISVGKELLVNYSPGYEALLKPRSNDDTTSSICAMVEAKKEEKLAAGGICNARVEKPEAPTARRKPTVDQCTETDPEPEAVKPPPATVAEAGVETDSILIDNVEIETQTETAISADAATDVPSPTPPDPEPELVDASVGDGEEDRVVRAEIETQTEATILADAATATIYISSPSPKEPEPESEPEIVDLIAEDDDDGNVREEDDDVIVYEMDVDEPEPEPEPISHAIENEELEKEHEVERTISEPTLIVTTEADESANEEDEAESLEPQRETLKERAEPQPAPESPEPPESNVDWVCKFCGCRCDSVPSFCLHLIEHYKQVGAARTEKARLKPKKRKRKRVTRRTRASSTSEESSSEEESTGSDEEESSDDVGLTPRFPYTCDLCLDQKVFNRGEYIIRHLKLHSMGRLIQEEDLTQVAKDKRGPPKSKCRTCNKNLSQSVFKMHTSICSAIRVHARDSSSRMSCPVCLSSFKQVDEFRDHVTTHTHSYKCNKCERRLKLRAELMDHVCTDCTPFYCDDPQCGGEERVKFQSVSMLQTHIQAKHTGVSADKLYFCYECCLPFASKTGLENHPQCKSAVALDTAKEVKSKAKTPKGPKASGKGKTTASSSPAPLPASARKNKNTNAEGCYVCEKCGVTYVSWNSMKTHRKTHGLKRFQCEECGKSFHRKDLLLGHQFTHKEPEFICDECGKRFKFRKSLALHAQIHAGVKRFACTECDLAFTQKINLLTHQKVHLPIEQRGFQCSICSKYFSSKEYLDTHLVAHEKGRQFSCSICGLKFFNRRWKIKHEKFVHTMKGVHICEFCPLRVKQSYSLAKHLHKYHAELKEKWDVPEYVNSRFDADADVPVRTWSENEPKSKRTKKKSKLKSRRRPANSSRRQQRSSVQDSEEEESDSDSDLESEFSEVVECEGGPRFDVDLYESEDEEIECPDEYNANGTVCGTVAQNETPRGTIAESAFVQPPPPLIPVAPTRAAGTLVIEQAQDSQFQDLVVPQGAPNSIWILDADGQNGVILEIDDTLIGMHDFVTVPLLGS